MPPAMAMEIAEHARNLSNDDLADALNDSGIETADGCYVEHDGRCEHGYPSPFLVLGMI